MASQKSFKKRKITDDVDGGGGGGGGVLDSLPGDILVDIFSRLPFSSIAQLMFVRKSWGSILTEDSRIFSSSSPTNPCLLLHSDFPRCNFLHFIDLSEEEKHVKIKRFNLRLASSMPEFEVVGSCNGLLCLSDSLNNDPLYLYNPFTTNSLQLPECSNKYQDQELVILGFGFHEKRKEYKVVKIVYFKGISSGGCEYKYSEVQILTLSSSTCQTLSWRSLGKAPYKFRKRSSEALVNGRLHFVTRPGKHVRKFVSFDLDDEEFREIPKPDCGGLNRTNLNVVSLKGCLCAVVYVNFEKSDIWVMKSYGVKESWLKEYSIGYYLPEMLQQNLNRPKWWPWKNAEEGGNKVRVLCALENGEILLEYKSRALVAYDPTVGSFRDLLSLGVPFWFHTVVHVGTLIGFEETFEE